MVRLWGGGVYEPDVFYDTCDGMVSVAINLVSISYVAHSFTMAELGILVWQDFQFACGVYPAHDEFVKSVKAEAEENVTRLRHHPSIVLFCGNNEGLFSLHVLMTHRLSHAIPLDRLPADLTVGWHHRPPRTENLRTRPSRRRLAPHGRFHSVSSRLAIWRRGMGHGGSDGGGHPSVGCLGWGRKELPGL